MKYGIWVIWIGGGAAILFGSGWISTTAKVVVWLTLAAHLAEFVVKRPLFQKVGGSMGHHFLQTMIYGLFHWKPLEATASSPSAPSGGTSD